MHYFPLRTVPGNVWPIIPSAACSQLWSVYLGLEQTQWLNATELQVLQLQQVRALLSHCQQAVPYYRRLFAESGIVPGDIQSLDEFRRIPVLRRRTYQEQFPDFCASGLPSGMLKTGKSKSTGTTGSPVNVWHTNVTNLWWIAFFLRDLQWCGFDPRRRLAAIRATLAVGAQAEQLSQGVTLPYWLEQLRPLMDTGPSFGLDLHQPPRRQLEWLREVNPHYLLSFAGNLEQLALQISEEGERLPSLIAIQNISEVLTDDGRLRIEAAFGVPVKNTYSSSEMGYMASPCPEGHGLHVHAENILLEVLDDQERPCRPGESGRVVVTALHNFLTPFIRYEIQDHVTMAAGSCPCGRGLPLLTQVEGKHRPMLHLPNGAKKPSRELIIGMRDIGGYFQHQIIQRTPEHLIIRIVPGRDWSASHEDRMRCLAFAYFGSPIQLELETVPRIEIPPGGKLTEVVIECEGAL